MTDYIVFIVFRNLKSFSVIQKVSKTALNYDRPWLG